MTIVVSRAGRPAVRLERTLIQNEAFLQRYIHEHPDVLLVDQVDEAIRPIVLVRELPTSSGPIDALAVDQEGNVYVVETKLYKNPDKRLVIAQALDYGAALWKAYSADPDELLSRLDGLLVATPGAKGLAARLMEAYSLDSAGWDELQAALKDTIAAGRYRFVVLMDRVEDRLKDLISYVTANSSFDLVGVALDFYEDGDLQILIPAVYGREVKKQTSAGSAGERRRWNEETYFADASAKLKKEQVVALRSLYDWAASLTSDIGWGTGAQYAAFSPKFSVAKRSPFTAYSDGRFSLNFKWLDEPGGAKAWRRRFGEALIREGFVLPPNFEDCFYTISLEVWAPRCDRVIAALRSVLEEAVR